MRILYLADIRFPIERANGIQTIETCYALAERGHVVRLFVRPDTAVPRRDPFVFYGLAPDTRLVIERAIIVGPHPARRAEYLVQSLAAIVAGAARTDVVITRDLGVASLALSLPRPMRAPIVYESHGFAPTFAETRGEMLSGAPPASSAKMTRLLERETRVWRAAEGYVTITDGLAADLTKRLGARERVMTIPDGVRLNPHRQFVPPRRSTVPVVAYAGHLYPWKGVDVLLKALALLPEVQGLVIGGHPAEGDRARLEGLAASLGVQDRVRFTGFVHRNDVTTLLEDADILVMPHTATPVSERYASPLKLFEYMALGKPIVASDLAAVREVLRDGETACLVKAEDPGALAAGISAVMRDAALAERIAHRAFDAASSYTWARRGERFETLLDVVARRS